MVEQYREAEEEVALPKSDHIHTICVLEPFLSQTRFLCTPVIALLTDLKVLDQLHAAPSEVLDFLEYTSAILTSSQNEI
jgi:peroxisomal coenzyme A diphosphatase NUDT7